MTPTTFVLEDSRPQILDYEAEYGYLLPRSGLKCVCGKRLHRDGILSHCRIARGLDLKLTVLKYYGYRCKSCKSPRDSKKCRVFSGISSVIIEQLPDYVRSKKIDFVSTNGSVLMMSTILSVILLTENGMLSFNGLNEGGKEVITNQLSDTEVSRLYLLDVRSRSVQSHRKGPLQGESIIDYVDVLCCASFCMISLAYIAQAKSQNPFIQTSFLNSANGMEQFCADMNHPFGNAGNTQGYAGNMHILNSFGEVVLGQAQHSKSMKESEAALREIAKRAPGLKGFHTDEPEMIKGVVHSAVWNDDAKFCKDLFTGNCRVFFLDMMGPISNVSVSVSE